MGYPFNKLPFGKDGEYITTVIEIPKGSMLKVEWRRHEEFFALDRVEPGIFAKPTNYGFIPQTLDEDGDELDVLLVTGEGLPMSTSWASSGRGWLSITSPTTRTSRKAAPSYAALSALRRPGRSSVSAQSAPKPTNGGKPLIIGL
jgi:hypothetical protein